jgi:hypothetical protein
LIRQKQQQGIVESSKTPIVHFNISTDGKNRCVKIVNDKTTFQSLTIGLGKSIKKSNVLSIEEEYIMLAQVMCHPTLQIGLNLKFGFFFNVIFFHKGLL